MITVNLKATAGIIGGAVAVAAFITGVIKKWDEDTNIKDVQSKQMDDNSEDFFCDGIHTELDISEDERSDQAESISADIADKANPCASCTHRNCYVEKTSKDLARCSGYNLVGRDPAGHTMRYYNYMIRKLRLRLNDACRQISNGEIRYAVYDMRTVMDETLRMIVNHSDGTIGTEQTMIENLYSCENRHLINGSKDFFCSLHRIRIICNGNEHRIDAEKTETGNMVCSSIMMIHELLNKAESVLVPV